MSKDNILLDDLDGFGFEDVMVDLFNALGYDHVEKADVVADEGRDILLDLKQDDETIRIVTECKHTDTVGRPVIQKLHSAVLTHDTAKTKAGMVVTTGKFTEPARTYAKEVTQNPDKINIYLIDGNDIKEFGQKVNMDLYSGKIEIICNERLPTPPTIQIEQKIKEIVNNLTGYDNQNFNISTNIALVPFIHVHTQIRAKFQTNTGTIHRIDDTDGITFVASPEKTEYVSGELSDFIQKNLDRTEPIKEKELKKEYETFDKDRFGTTKRQYREHIKKEQQDKYTETVKYTGDNNVEYEKTCKPALDDIDVIDLKPLYVPFIQTNIEFDNQNYQYNYYSSYPGSIIVTNDFAQCNYCDEEEHLFFCRNCYAVSCSEHTHTEAVEKTPICNNCGVTESFMFKTYYFYNQKNLNSFKMDYASKNFIRKLLTNKKIFVIPIIIFIVTIITGILFYNS